MEQLSPANQALIAKMQNNQVQVQAQTQTSKAPELPSDTVELSTKVKKPKNKAGALIAGIIAGATIATGLIVAYKKGVFFKLEGAMLKKEADKAYQKAQVVVDEVMELIKKGEAEGLEEFVDENTGRTVKILGNTIKEYDGDTLVRSSDLYTFFGNYRNITTYKKGKLDTMISLRDGKIYSIEKGLTFDKNGHPFKTSRTFNYEDSSHIKSICDINKVNKWFAYNSDGEVASYTKQTKTHSTEWSQENGFKREKLIKPEVDIEPEEEIFVEEDFNEEEVIEVDDFEITGNEETATQNDDLWARVRDYAKSIQNEEDFAD